MAHRLYIDESGDHTSSHATDTGKRYLGLVGVMFEQGKDYSSFAGDLEGFKKTHLDYDPDEPIILHREDIKNKRGPYPVLQDDWRREAFNDGLVQLFDSAKCTVIAVVLDKYSHRQATYRRLRHPYHYCLLGMLERYCGRLNLCHQTGDVMAEARGAAEDAQLKAVYEDLWTRGKMYLSQEICQKTLTTKHLKVKLKRSNIAGLQLADILAHPLTRDVLSAYGRLALPDGTFASRICEVAKKKYNKQVYQGRINGYGRVILA